MKKLTVFIMTALLLALPFLSACSQTGADMDVSDIPSPSPSVSDTAPPSPSESTPAETASPSPTEGAAPAPEPFNFEEQTYTQDTISIIYPRLTGLADEQLQDDLNGIIYDAAMQGLDEQESGTEYELTSTVSLNTPDVISIWFDGYYYAPGAAHPGLLLFGVNIDVASRRPVALGDLVTIDNGFVELLRNGEFSSSDFDMTDQIRSDALDYLSDDESMIAQLRDANSSIWSTGYYLTPDALVVSVAVAHVMGDHMEISIPYGDLSPFKTDHPVWDVLGA